MPTKPLRLTRDQLAKFLPDHETIRQFERLLTFVDELDQTVLEEIENEAASAVATANAALVLIDSYRIWKRIGTILSPINTGDSVTIDGAAVFNDEAGDNDFQVKKNTSGDAVLYDAGADAWSFGGAITANDALSVLGLLTQTAKRGTRAAVAATSTLTQTATDWEITASGITVSAWASPVVGDRILVYANMGSGTFTMSGNGNNMDGSASLTIYDGETWEWIYNGTEWIS